VNPIRGEPVATIGIMSVATNLYLDYWKTMVQSAESVSKIEDEVTFFVFTDDPKNAEIFAKDLKNVAVKVFGIEPYGWPEATLLRYTIFNSQIHEMKSDILMHLDADMLFSRNPWSRVRSRLVTERICLVLHPGFWRPTGAQRVMLYASNPILAYKDLRMKVKKGGLGAWEENPKSESYVPRKLRKNYFCGGTWFGKNEAIKILLKQLENQVSSDRAKDITARWHDESHINNWATENRHTIENPELCFDETYPQIRNLTPSIIAVRKIEKTR
jgi:hypothetical protein